jgi:hypothetical protein
MKIAINLIYNGKIKDAPCTKLPGNDTKANKIRDWYIKKFPECTSQEYFRFFLVLGRNELRDEITGSYYNLDCASVVATLLEMMVKDQVITPKEASTITHYTAQQRVYNHAHMQAHLESPEYGFDLLLNFTTDEFQGDDNDFIIADPVRTEYPGFTANRGRNCVMLTRAKKFMVVVGNTENLKAANQQSNNLPIMKRAFEEAKELGVCIEVSKKTHTYLMEHKYVHARVMGTEANNEAIQTQTFADDDEDEADGSTQQSPTSGNNDGWVQPSNGGWGDNGWEKQAAVIPATTSPWESQTTSTPVYNTFGTANGQSAASFPAFKHEDNWPSHFPSVENPTVPAKSTSAEKFAALFPADIGRSSQSWDSGEWPTAAGARADVPKSAAITPEKSGCDFFGHRPGDLFPFPVHDGMGPDTSHPQVIIKDGVAMWKPDVDKLNPYDIPVTAFKPSTPTVAAKSASSTPSGAVKPPHLRSPGAFKHVVPVPDEPVRTTQPPHLRSRGDFKSAPAHVPKSSSSNC